MVHKEIISLSDTITGMISRMPEICSNYPKKVAYGEILTEKEEILPEYSEELPEGMEGILEQFM